MIMEYVIKFTKTIIVDADTREEAFIEAMSKYLDDAYREAEMTIMEELNDGDN